MNHLNIETQLIDTLLEISISSRNINKVQNTINKNIIIIIILIRKLQNQLNKLE